LLSEKVDDAVILYASQENNNKNNNNNNNNNSITSNINTEKSKDTDGDGISDFDEKNSYATDPNNSDTDDDRINDGKEIKGWIWSSIENLGFCDDLGNTINNPDIANIAPLCIVQKTNPLLSDTDRDGNDDFFEYNFLLANALEGDQDRDELIDGLEFGASAKYKTSFLQFDTDGDGVSDGQEVIAGTNPLDPTDNPQASKLLTDRTKQQNPLASLPYPPGSTGLNPPLRTPPLSQGIPGNEPPRPYSQSITIKKNTPSIPITLFATDPNGQDRITFYIRSYPVLGHFSNQIMYVDRNTAKVLYFPSQNVIGKDVFTFWATDGKEFSRNRGIININIIP
jgi:hypothetical protein